MNYDGLQAVMMSWWEPVVSDLDHPFAGVGEGVDYGEIDRSREWWKDGELTCQVVRS